MNQLYSASKAMAGLYRALVVTPYDKKASVYIPALHKDQMPFEKSSSKDEIMSSDSINVTLDGTITVNGKELIMKIYDFPIATLSVPSLCLPLERGESVWVTFENGDSEFPVIMGNVGSTVEIGDISTLFGESSSDSNGTGTPTGNNTPSSGQSIAGYTLSSGLTIDASIPSHPGNYGGTRNVSDIKYIVIHYTGVSNDTALGNVNHFKSTDKSKTQYGAASAHYFVDQGTTIYQSVPDNVVAYHCGTTGTYKHSTCRNANSIGIEISSVNRNGSSSADDTGWYFREETIEHAAELTRCLMSKYNVSLDNVIRHYDVTGKTCPAPYVHHPNDWVAFKNKVMSIDSKFIVNSGSSTAESALEYAKSKLGCSYVYGASGPDTFDCSGLMQWAYKQAGVNISRITTAQMNDGTAVSTDIKQAKPGDLAFPNSGHVVMVSNPATGEYIHSPHTGDVVKLATYYKTFIAIRRIC